MITPLNSAARRAEEAEEDEDDSDRLRFLDLLLFLDLPLCLDVEQEEQEDLPEQPLEPVIPLPRLLWQTVRCLNQLGLHLCHLPMQSWEAILLLSKTKTMLTLITLITFNNI